MPEKDAASPPDSLEPMDGTPTPEPSADEGIVDVSRSAVVLKAELRREPSLEDPLHEIVSLADTAGIDVAEGFLQRLERPHPATYLGSGKIEEAATRAKELDVDFLIADNDLSPGQERNLEKASKRTVLDRSQLIMDIFSQRADTNQAKLQVELAQLRYSLPRLKRMWTHLSRYEGGIGMRGPGETQLETDKRLIGRRIQKLQRQLKRIEKRKETSLEHRQNEFVVALVGYTNAGKSTLLNRLTGSGELVEDKLFATLDTRVRRWHIAEHRHVLLTDTVGFIRDLPHHLVASFHATLAETQHADLLLHVVDASSPDATWQIETVEKVLEELECHEKPTWLVLNKWDRVPDERRIEAQSLRDVWATRRPLDLEQPQDPADAPWRNKTFLVSARGGDGIEELEDELLAYVERHDARIELSVPHDRGDVIAYLRENGRVDSTDYRDEAVHVTAQLSPARLARLQHIFPEGFPKPGPKQPWER